MVVVYRRLGPGGDSLLGGANCEGGGGVGGGSVDPGSVCSLKKKLNPADAFFLYKINSFKGDN